MDAGPFGGHQRVDVAGREHHHAGLPELLGHARGHDRVRRPRDVGAIERPELSSGQKEDVGTAGQRGDRGGVEQVARQRLNALRFEARARGWRREAGDSDHPACAAGSRDGPVDAAGQRRPHLAAGAENQHVAVQTRRTFEIRVRRFREYVLELGLRVDLFREPHPLRILPNRGASPLGLPLHALSLAADDGALRSRGSLPPPLPLRRDLAEAPTARRRALPLVRCVCELGSSQQLLGSREFRSENGEFDERRPLPHASRRRCATGAATHSVERPLRLKAEGAERRGEQVV